jgi:hypothetical protein
MSTLDLTAGARLGRVVRVEGGATVALVKDAALLARVTVNDLVATPGRRPGEHLIALVEDVSADSDEARRRPRPLRPRRAQFPGHRLRLSPARR